MWAVKKKIICKQSVTSRKTLLHMRKRLCMMFVFEIFNLTSMYMHHYSFNVPCKSHFVIPEALCNNSLSHFVIADIVCNNSLSQFVIADTVCNNSLLQFVIADTVCNNSLSQLVILDAFCNTCRTF